MSENKFEGWKLDLNEVRFVIDNSSSEIVEQSSRTVKITSSCMSIEHLPTTIKVEGEIPEGNYNKIELQRLRSKMKSELFKKLEQLVTKQLNDVGR